MCMILQQMLGWTIILGILLHHDSKYFFGSITIMTFLITTILNVSYAADGDGEDDDDDGEDDDDDEGGGDLIQFNYFANPYFLVLFSPSLREALLKMCRQKEKSETTNTIKVVNVGNTIARQRKTTTRAL